MQVVEQPLEAYPAQCSAERRLRGLLVIFAGTQRDLQKNYRGHSLASDEDLLRQHG